MPWARTDWMSERLKFIRSGFNMSGTDSKAGGHDYLLLFLQAKSIAEKTT